MKLQAPSHHLRAAVFVWGIWIAMLGAALGFVSRYGSNVPSWDGWDMVPTLTGNQPVTATWLWSQHNEHRVALPRLTLLGLHQITGINFRVPMFFNVLALGALAFTMILMAKRLRGEISYTDAFFPLLLLHWGHAANFLWGWQVQFISSVLLSGIVLLVIVQSSFRLTFRANVIIGICLVLLPFCGANGLALVPVLASWLGYSAIVYRCSGELHSGRQSNVILALVAVALIILGLYFVGYENVPYHPTSRGTWDTLGISAKFLTIGFGPAVRHMWPFSGLVVSIILLASIILALVTFRDQPEQRYRVIGLLCFLCAMAVLMLAIGMGRNGFEPRYVTLAVPLWCCIFFVWSIYGPSKLNLLGRMVLLVVTCLALGPNTSFGLAYARDLRSHLRAFERDMVAGVPSAMLIARHWRYLHVNHDLLTDYLSMLYRAGVGQFRFLRENVAFREITLRLEPTVLNEVQWKNATAYGTGKKDPYVVFALPKNRYVYGIRIKYSYWNKEGTAPRRFVYWKRGEQTGFPEEQHAAYVPTGDHANWSQRAGLNSRAAGSITKVWIDDTIKEVKIYPDLKTSLWNDTHPKPFAFHISELALLVPAHE